MMSERSRGDLRAHEVPVRQRFPCHSGEEEFYCIQGIHSSAIVPAYHLPEV